MPTPVGTAASSTCGFLALCVVAIGPGCRGGESHAGDDTSTTAPGGPGGPQAGAPDEHCNLDPDRVYLIETPLEFIAYTSLTDLEDPSILCAVREQFRDRIRLDPQDGSLLTLRGPDVWRVHQDWMEPNGPNSELWVPALDGEDNDEELGRIMQSPTITCRADDPRVLLTDDVHVYASCGGPWFNAPQVAGVNVHQYLVGLVGDRKIFKAEPFTMSGYSVEVAGEYVLQPIPIPGDVDAVEHLAVRPVAGALLAAVQVSRGDTITTEQARIDGNGVTLVGAYAHDVGEAGIGRMDYALAADGTLFGMEILPSGSDEESPQRIVRMALDEAPAVILTTTFVHQDRPPRLVAVGAGGPTPAAY